MVDAGQLKVILRGGRMLLELALLDVAGEPFTLPRGVVGVLNLQFRQWRWPPLQKGAVQGLQFMQEHAHRPAVGDDVVHGHEQDMLLRRHGDHARAQQRAGAQVERQQRFLATELEGGFGALLRRQRTQVDALHPQRHGVFDQLHRFAVNGDKTGAQRLMPLHQPVQAAFEQVRVKPSVEAHHARHVIEGIARLDLVENPQSLLSERHRKQQQIGIIRALFLRGGVWMLDR